MPRPRNSTPPRRSPGQPLGRPPPPHPGRERVGATALAARGPRRGEDWLYGRHPVVAALANPARRWRRLAVLAGQREEAATLAAAAAGRRRDAGDDPVQVLDRGALAALLPEGAVHQGWALEAEPLAQPELDAMLEAVESPVENPAGRDIIVVLDQVADPHNVGAVLRSAAAFGARAVIVATHGAPPPSAALAKAASGALEALPLISVVNLTRALDRLKEAGFWCCGLEETAPQPLAALDLGQRVALVLGSEGAGLRRLVREHCDYLARLPTRPDWPSLNISNAAAIALYELARGDGAG